MGKSHFFALISRMKHIARWGLMRNTRRENISEHSLDVAVIAHALAVLRNRRFGGSVSPERAATLALYHDASEIFTGDLPTPVKYYNPEIKQAYHQVENISRGKLLRYLPADLQPDYRALLIPDAGDSELWSLVKAADKLSALIKCIEEQKMGNHEFDSAALSLRQAIDRLNLPEVSCFTAEFLPSFALTLDEQGDADQ